MYEVSPVDAESQLPLTTPPTVRNATDAPVEVSSPSIDLHAETAQQTAAEVLDTGIAFNQQNATE